MAEIVRVDTEKYIFLGTPVKQPSLVAQSSKEVLSFPFFPRTNRSEWWSESQVWEYHFLSKMYWVSLERDSSHCRIPLFVLKLSAFSFLSHFWPTVDGKCCSAAATLVALVLTTLQRTSVLPASHQFLVAYVACSSKPQLLQVELLLSHIWKGATLVLSASNSLTATRNGFISVINLLARLN